MAYLLITVGNAIKTGVIVFPGIIVIVLLVAMSRPRRELAITPGGLLELHQSLVNGAPDRIQAMLLLTTLPLVTDGPTGTVQTSIEVPIGNDRIRLKRATCETLHQATRNFGTNPASGLAATAPVLPPGWFPDPLGRYQYRYWNCMT